MLGTVFIIFINNLDDGVTFTLSKFRDDTKLRGMADSPLGHAAIHRDLNTQQRWADKSLKKFNKEKSSVLHLGRNMPRHLLSESQEDLINI